MKREMKAMHSLSRRRLTSPRPANNPLVMQNDAKVQSVLDATKSDTLRTTEREERQRADRFILLAAKLISPGTEGEGGEGG